MQTPASRRDPLRMNKKKVEEPADKQDFVVDSHSSRTCVATGLKRPTQIQCKPLLNGFLFGLSPRLFHSPLRVTAQSLYSILALFCTSLSTKTSTSTSEPKWLKTLDSQLPLSV